MNLQEEQILEATKHEVKSACRYLVEALTHKANAEYRDAGVSVMSNNMLKTMIEVRCQYKLPEGAQEEIKFLIKHREPFSYHSHIPALLRRDSKGREREFENYEFLRGIPSVPRAYLMEKILGASGMKPREVYETMRELKVLSNSIILELRGGSTFREVLKNTEREKAVRDIIEPLVDFQIEATKRSAGRGESMRSRLRERQMKTKIVDYVRGAAGLDNVVDIPIELRKEIIINYAPTISEYDHPIQTPVTCHGDFTPTNIIAGDFSFVDPQLKWRDSLIDISCLLASPGIALSTEIKEDIAISFKLLSASKSSGLVAMVEGKLPRLLRVQAGSVLVADMQRKIRGAHNKMELHYAIRNLAIIRDLEDFPGMYKGSGSTLQDTAEMKSNIVDAFGRLINHPEELGLKQEEAECYERFKGNLLQMGIISNGDVADAGKNKSARIPAAEDKQSA